MDNLALKKTIQDYLDNLNQEQKLAATLGNESAVILAAAGSGKTSTLTCRIAYLHVIKEVQAHHILAVTFTNKAAKEMSQRLYKMGVDIKNMWIGTFHGICNKILKYHYQEAGLKKSFTIMDSSEQESFLKRVLRSNQIDPKSVNIKDLLHKINNYKEVGWRSSQLIQSKEKDMYAMYEKACIKENCVDFGELLLGCYELFKNHPIIADSYAEKFRHILVDEFQDTNELQYKWLAILSQYHKNVFAVGDDDQSIYSFRGAKPENMNLLKKDYQAKVIKIEKNYRSDAYILEGANHLIQHNKNRQGKNLVPTHQAKNKIKYFDAFNDEEESAFIAQEIKKIRRKNVAFKDMCILYRTNSQSRSLEKALHANGIPYIIYGGFRFFDRQEIKHAMSYLKLALNAQDNNALLRIINIPARAIGDTAIKKLEILAQEKNLSIYETILSLDEKQKKKFQNFIDVIEYIKLINQGKNIKQMIENVIVKSGLENMYEMDKKDGPERLDNLYELLSAAEVFMLENSQQSISQQIDDFIDFSTLESDIQSNKKNDQIDAVKMMTVHMSKGLEFDTVFIAGLEEGLFPHANSIGEKDALEEERRLMYVALTRARKNLYLSTAEERLIHGMRQRLMKSRFLKELPPNVLEKYR